jgi:hypothetical protein
MKYNSPLAQSLSLSKALSSTCIWHYHQDTSRKVREPILAYAPYCGLEEPSSSWPIILAVNPIAEPHQSTLATYRLCTVEIEGLMRRKKLDVSSPSSIWELRILAVLPSAAATDAPGYNIELTP